ncbi:MULTISPECIES: hypothetical protein [Gordonia]|nr:hypothetical protein [Gordonia paraffinivorans]MCD2146375.1 hypothetical protein [Gordonia paraffinivorans]
MGPVLMIRVVASAGLWDSATSVPSGPAPGVDVIGAGRAASPASAGDDWPEADSGGD